MCGDVPHLDPQALREVQAMRRVCEAAQQMRNSFPVGEVRRLSYNQNVRIDRLGKALADLERARKGEG